MTHHQAFITQFDCAKGKLQITSATHAQAIDLLLAIQHSQRHPEMSLHNLQLSYNRSNLCDRRQAGLLCHIFVHGQVILRRQTGVTRCCAIWGICYELIVMIIMNTRFGMSKMILMMVMMVIMIVGVGVGVFVTEPCFLRFNCKMN